MALTQSNVADINAIALFLANPEVVSLLDHPPVDVIVLCGSAILAIAENVFAALQLRPDLSQNLIICGGIGHSTQYLYDAVRSSKKYGHLAGRVEGLAEARVLELVLKEHYPELMKAIEAGDIRLIVEDRSTNCGANAGETRRVLESSGLPVPRRCLVVQDPTMSLRTLAGFQHTYEDVSPSPKFETCPTFVPQLQLDDAGATLLSNQREFSMSTIRSDELWSLHRFLDLLMGEIPRLRDDANGYGPKGRNFIAHVDIPAGMEEAFARLRPVLEFQR